MELRRLRLLLLGKIFNVFEQFFIVNNEHDVNAESLQRFKKDLCVAVVGSKRVDNSAWGEELRIHGAHHFGNFLLSVIGSLERCRVNLVSVQKLLQVILLLLLHWLGELVHLREVELIRDDFGVAVEKGESLVLGVVIWQHVILSAKDGRQTSGRCDIAALKVDIYKARCPTQL